MPTEFSHIYFLQDEIVAVSEKAVLRVADLLDWIASPKEVKWERGIKGVCEADCQAPLASSKNLDGETGTGSSDSNSPEATGNNHPMISDKVLLSAKQNSGMSEFLADVKAEKEAIGIAITACLCFLTGLFTISPYSRRCSGLG